MVDIKTEPEATTTTTTTSAAAATTIKTDTNEQSDPVSDYEVGTKIKNDASQASNASNDSNNNNNNGAGPRENDEDDDDDAEFEDDEEERSNNHQNGRPKEDNEKTNLIVNYLPQQMTDEDFEELFKPFGKMKSCKIVRNRNTGYSYGFGFVDYETHEQALKAIDELNGHEVDTKKIKVAFARPAGQDIKQANLYVKNVPSSWSQEDVRKVFEPYGSIIQVRVLGNDRGVAFVLFDLRKQAQDALDALNGKQVDGCESPFEIKFAAEKKGENQRASRGGGGGNGGGGNKNRMNRRGGNRGGNFGGGSRNNQNNNNGSSNNNINNNNNRNNRSNSNNRRSTSQGRGGNMFMNNNSNNSNNYGSMNGSVGPIRQQQTNRSNRYAPFVPVQQPPPTMVPQPTPMTPYGYAQQPMLPYMMPGQSMMQMPMGQQAIQMASAPINPYSMGAPIAPIGYAQPPMAQPSAAMNNMYNVASNTMNNAAQMQPQLGQPMNMRGNSSGSGGGGGGGGGGLSDGVTLFVYNIGPDCDENELKGMFAPYGAVIRCNVVRKTPGGETKGFGFVTLRNRDNANAAIAGLNNSTRNGRSLQVSFKK